MSGIRQLLRECVAGGVGLSVDGDGQVRVYWRQGEVAGLRDRLRNAKPALIAELSAKPVDAFDPRWGVALLADLSLWREWRRAVEKAVGPGVEASQAEGWAAFQAVFAERGRVGA